jgi:hypothetical protein
MFYRKLASDGIFAEEIEGSFELTKTGALLRCSRLHDFSRCSVMQIGTRSARFSTTLRRTNLLSNTLTALAFSTT